MIYKQSRGALGFVSLPHPAPTARDILFFDILLVAPERVYDLYGKYDNCLHVKYVKYAELLC